MHLQWNIWTIRKEGEIMGDAIISVEELSKSFGQHEVLRKIDFNVEPGEIICIVGSSGSGKSTLLRCINKLETQTSGKIRYHGKEIGAVQKEINDYRSKVGMVFQSFNLFNNMTVLQNCMLCTRKVLHLSKEEAFDRAITHLKQVGMAPFINANPTQLSGGQKQRVAIARSLCMNPEVLLFDEPTSASAAAQETGCPPKVVPWEPGVNAFATSSVAQIAPIGIPPPRAFAMDTISGLIP